MRALILAQAAPGQDNFSAIAVWVTDPAESTHPMADMEATMPAPSGGG
mgnify:FL=1